MKLTVRVLRVAIFSALVTGLAAGSALAGGGNCQSKLVGNSYNCNFEGSNGASVSYCVEFETGGISSNFDLFLVSVSADYGCACLAKGSYNSPRFDESTNEFQCTAEFGTQLDGKVTPKKISGQGATYEGLSFFWSCTQTPSCT